MNVMQLLLKKYRRKVNKVIKGGSILSILFSIIISLVIPPFNIYADTLTMANIIGVNYTVSSSDVIGTVTFNNQSYNRYSVYYDVEIQLDDSYLGWCQLTLEYDWYDRDSSGIVNKNNNVTRRIYINGNSVHINLNIVNNYGPNPLQLTYNNPRVTTITNSNVTLYGDLSTLQDIYNILLDVQQNVTDSEQLLSDISRLRQYKFPVESFGFIQSLINNGYSMLDFTTDGYYMDYPIFRIPSNNNVFTFGMTANREYRFIFGISYTWGVNDILNHINKDSRLTYSVIWSNYRGTQMYRFYCISIKAPSNFGSATEYINLSFDTTLDFIPVFYYNPVNPIYVSTDFALLWGLSNQLLDDLHIIASGTNQSNTSSSDLENQKGSFDTTSNSLYTSENAFNTDMNNKLQSIDTSFNPSTSFGSKFLSSADWVRTQFNNLTSISPFGTVLSFSMLLGLSLLIIGKVFK